MENWTKYTFVCDPDACDTLIEVTCKEFDFPNGEVKMSCPCGRVMQLVSYVDATINPTTEKEEQPMETMTTDFMQEQIKILQDNLSKHTNCDYWKAENGRVQGQIIDVIDEIVAGNWIDADDIANTLCEIIDYNPKKEIEFTATMRFTGKIEIDAREANDFDLTAILEDAYVDINNGDVVIDNYELYDAEEC